MMSTVGLELTSFINSDWTWKTVSKRNRSGTRRTRKLVANSFIIGKVIADKNVGTPEDVTVSESEKVGVDVLGRRFSGKLENVPHKKRRFMFRSPSPPPPLNHCPHPEASLQPAPDQSVGPSASRRQQLMKSDCSAKNVASTDDEKISEVINGVEDFSGIAILAAAACSDGICNDVTEHEGNHLVKASTQERIQSSTSNHLKETTASPETVCCFPKDSVNETKFEGSSYQENSFAVLHEFPSHKNTTPERLDPLPDDRLLWDLNVPVDAWSCDGGIIDSQKDSFGDISVKSEELQTKEPEDIKNYATNELVSSDSQKDSFDTIPARSEELQTEEPQGIKNDTTNEVLSSDVDGGNRMTSDLRTMPVETDNLSTETKESEGCSAYDSQKDSFDAISARSEELQSKESQDMKTYATKEVISSDVNGVNRVTSDLRTMPAGTDDLSIEEQECKGCAGYDSQKDSFDAISARSEELQTKELQDLRNDTTNEVVSSDVDGTNKVTSDLRIMSVGTDDLRTEKQESEGCSGYESQKASLDTISLKTEELQTKEPQNFKTDTANGVVSSDVDGGYRMTSDLRTMPGGTDDLSTGKQESEGCSGYDSQFEDGELRESDVQGWEEAELVDYDTEFEEGRPPGLEAESGEQEIKVESGSNPELIANSQCFETEEALRKNSVSLKIRTMEVSDAETMKIDCLDGSNYDLRVDLSKVSKREFLSCVEGSLSSDVRRSRFDNFNCSYPRAERGASPDRFLASDRSSHVRGRSPGRAAPFFNPLANYWGSKRPHPPIYHACRPKRFPENREYPVGTDQAPSEAAGVVARPDNRITRQFTGSYRPLRRRSPIERDDSYSMNPRMPTVRDTSPDRNRFRRYSQGVRGIKDEYLRHIPDDNPQYMSRMPHYLDRRERSISPHGRPRHTIPYKRPRSRSRSRSRSPIGWLLQRDRNEGSRRHNRSPDFRSYARVRLPITKRFAAGYGVFGSPPRSRVSPQRNSRMLEDRNPGFDHFRGRKPHVRMIQQDQRFSNDYFNPMIRPRRYPDSR